MIHAKAYSAASATSPLALDTIPRRETTEHDAVGARINRWTLYGRLGIDSCHRAGSG